MGRQMCGVHSRLRSWRPRRFFAATSAVKDPRPNQAGPFVCAARFDGLVELVFPGSNHRPHLVKMRPM